MTVRFTSFVSAILLLLLAVAISATGAPGAEKCFVAAMGLILTGAMAPKFC